MKITCPKCVATYDIPEERVISGQHVRCAKCENVWSPLRVMVAAAKAMPVEGASPSADQPDAGGSDIQQEVLGSTRLRGLGQRWALASAWVLTLAIMAGFAAFAITRRAEIMHAWPPSERAYALFGQTR